ncbi:hypothetical protein ACFL3U_01605 [Pseudomonadota bacterium]
MKCSSYKLALAYIALISISSLAAAEGVPKPVSVTDIPPSNAAELGAEKNAQITFKQTAQIADAALKKARAEGGDWREAANLLMQSSVTSRSGDFKTATKMASQAQLMAEESYKAAVAAKKAEAERKAAAAKKAAEEKEAAARKAAASKNNPGQAKLTK